MLTSHQTTEEIKRSRTRMAILPIGATEQHSGHLPLATDSLIIEAIAQRVANKLKAYCLPVLPYSISHMHRGSRGSVWLRNQSLAAVMHDIAVSLRDDGFREFVILNGHGGNFILLPIVQDLNMDFPDLLTILLKPTDFIAESGIFSTNAPWRHADEIETSLMLHVRPELVNRKRVVDQPREITRELLRYFPFERLSRRTHTGKPTRATVAQGRRAIEYVVRRSVASIRDTIRKVGSHRRR